MPTPGKTSPKPLHLTLIAAGVFLLAAVLLPWLAGERQAILGGGSTLPPAAANYPAPDLTLSDLEGRPVALGDLLGRVVLVNNWATWCPPCREEIPDLQAYFAEHHSEGLEVYAVEAGEPAGEVAAFVESYGMTYTVLLDPGGLALQAFANWALPSTYVIDRDGQVVLVWNGAVDRQTLETYVTPLLNR